jgi:5-methyltetrahydrofolate--homocysteine methyltransferase
MYSINVSSDELIAERVRGIRPAYGYPASPDHRENGTLFSLLAAGEIGMELTETYATPPASSDSGIYLGPPSSRYFAVGRIGRDQAEDYALRKGMALAEVERWLRPNLAYEPEAAPAVA